VLHVLSKLVVYSQLRHLRASRLPVGVPLGGRSPILESATTGRGVSTELPRNCRWGTAHSPGDLTHPKALRVQDRDFFSLGERQEAPRERGRAERRHAATFAEPPRP